MSYTAIVSRISVRPHPNADKIQLGTVLGNQVVVSLDTTEGQLGVYFPCDGQLSEDFCLAKFLYNLSARNKLGLDASASVGFFDIHRRVRAQSFRGEKSDGFWVPVSYLDWTGAAEGLKEGDQFTELGGYPICNKYYNPKTLRALQGHQQQASKKNPFFPEHIDTTQFRFVAETIPDDGTYYITEKLHGTSGRFGHVPEELERNWWQRLLRYPTKSWAYLNGSRRVTIGTTTGAGYYGTNQFRFDAVANLSLRKGEILFFELVGYVSGQTKIMPDHDASKLADKAFLTKFGQKIPYTYGCPEGVSRLFLYKIANVNEDGVITELPWFQLCIRAKELGLSVVPLLSGPLTASQLKTKWSTDNFSEALRWEVESWTASQESSIHPLQVKEGIVLRVESPSVGISHVKNKGYEFKVMEGILKEADTSVDLEEVS